jgi:hypothetical protein
MTCVGQLDANDCNWRGWFANEEAQVSLTLTFNL